MFISGLHFPLLSAGLGFAWAVSRVLYAQGYTSKGPKGRYMYVLRALSSHFGRYWSKYLTRTSGAVHALFDLVLKITSGYTAYTFIRGGL